MAKHLQVHPLWYLLFIGDENAWEDVIANYYFRQRQTNILQHPKLILFIVLNFLEMPELIHATLTDLQWARNLKKIVLKYMANLNQKDDVNYIDIINKFIKHLEDMETKIFDEYFTMLIQDDRDEIKVAKRVGFPLSIVEKIQQMCDLHDIHKKRYLKKQKSMAKKDNY